MLAARTSSSCATRSPPRTRRPSRSCGGTSGCRSTGRPDLHHDRRPVPPGQPSARSCATSPGARPTSPRRRRCGTSTSRRRSPRPSSRTGSSPAPTTGSPSRGPDGEPRRHRDHPARAARRLRRAGRPPRRRALPAAVRHRRSARRCSASRCRSRPPAGRARQGHRHRHDLHLRRPHRRHLVARARPARPRRSSAANGRLLADAPDASSTRRPAAYAELAGKTVQAGQASAWSSCCGESGDLRRRAPPDHPPGEVLREGRQARSRSSPPASGTSATAGATATCGETLLDRGQGARLAPRLHAGPLRELGRGPQRRLAHQPPALLRRADPGLVPRSTPTATLDYDHPIVPDEDALPSTRRPTCPPGYDEAQRGQPGGFVGDPDVMDTWATSSLTPQIAGGWERRPRPVRAGLPDGPAPAGPRDHPHLAVLHRASGPTSSTARSRGDTPPSPAGSSTPTARRCRSPRATSSRRWPCSSSTARRRALLGGQRRGRAPTPRSTRAR